MTAQKRAENLQDVPISVSAVQGEQIQDATIFNMAALADYVPNLHIADAAVNTNIYMRGIGSGNNRGFEQSVGMYLDGVYLGRGRQYRAGLMDVERVEVLRGPQGTLFGRNTVAGAINITSASPVTGEGFEGEINASMEENGGQIYDGYVQGGGDTFAARLAVRYRETDGYVYNAFLEQDEGATDETGARLTLVWQPTDTFSANFKYSNLQRERTGSNSATWLYLNPAERDQLVPNRSAFASTAYAITDIFFPELADIAGRDFTTYKDNNFGNSQEDGIGISFLPDSSDDTIENFSLNMQWDVAGGTLTSVTGIAMYEYEDDVDVDWLPLQFISRWDAHEFEQFSQELRFDAEIGDNFSYTVGAYYDESELDMQGRVTIDTNFDGIFPQFAQAAFGVPLPNLLVPLTGGAYSADQISRNHAFTQDSESLALFFQGSYILSEALTLTFGVRYTEETKDATSRLRLGDSNCGIDGFANTSLPGCENGYNYFLNIVQATSFNTYERSYVGDRKTDDLTPSVNLQWTYSDDSMFYVSFSQGFKSGGFSAADDGEPGGFAVGQIPPPGFIATTPNEDFEFDDETVDAFEIGGKHEFMGGAMRLNWAAFYTEYENLQTTIFKGVGFSVKNAASSEVQGVEVDLQWQLTDSLRVGGNVAYLDATYGDFANSPCTAIQLDADPACGTPLETISNDLTGQQTLYASEYSGSLFADYRIPVGSMDFFAQAEVNYRDDFNSAGDNDPIDVIEAYTKVNARVGLTSDRWELMLYGRNIFDEAALQQSFDTTVLAGSHTYFMEEGAVFGARATLRF